MAESIHGSNSTRAALEAFSRGFVPIPIRDGAKRPVGSAWPHTRWENEEQIRAEFDTRRGSGAGGVGLLLGSASRGLVDVDLDHPKALRLRDHLLPPSWMQTGRITRPRTHRWYLIEGELPVTRQFKLPDRTVLVELRSSGAQTIIPPSIHPSGESYRWEGEPWGGEPGPALIDGTKLSIQVALLGIGAVLLEVWPSRGGRHEAYLALAGGLLRFGHEGVHPYWEKNLPVLIAALADVTGDDDGADSRVKEVMDSTLRRLKKPEGKAIGFPRLGEIIGSDHVELVRRWAREIEELAGFVGVPTRRLEPPGVVVEGEEGAEEEDADNERSPTPPERVSSWGEVDLEPYLSGEIVMAEPGVLYRDDGKGLFYPGRVNGLYGMSEAAKTWLSLHLCVEAMSRGEKVLQVDLEDLPASTIERLRALGAWDDDLRNLFRYVQPDEPIAGMQWGRWGQSSTEEGRLAEATFRKLLDSFKPDIIILDTMNVLYGLHGQDTNDATGTAVISDWIKSLTRNGLTAVIVLDHTGKGGGANSTPIGAHHKVAMIQGSSIRIDVIDRPAPGRVGKMQLIVNKDRPGAVRAVSTLDKEAAVGTVVMDSTTPGQTRIKIEVPADAVDRKLQSLSEQEYLCDIALGMFGGVLGVRVTNRNFRDKTGVSETKAKDVWDMLVATRQVDRLGGDGKHRYYVLHDPVRPSVS